MFKSLSLISTIMFYYYKTNQKTEKDNRTDEDKRGKRNNFSSHYFLPRDRTPQENPQAGQQTDNDRQKKIIASQSGKN